MSEMQQNQESNVLIAEKKYSTDATKHKVVLGIDIGGTNTGFGFFSADGKCHTKDSIPTKADEPAKNLFSRLFMQVMPLLNEKDSEYELVGVGIGAPNANYYTGKIENPPNLKWGTVNIVEMVQRTLDVPVFITNDANAAAMGELLYGAAQKYRHFVEITLGTGLGSGIVINGDILLGHDGFAGEIGHVTVKENGRTCGCGKRGCLETYVSANGLIRTVLELLAVYNEPSPLRSISPDTLSSKTVYDLAKSGDVIAQKAFEKTGEILGRAMADTVAHLSPEAIVLFGGLANAKEMIISPAKKAMEENLLGVFRNKVSIVQSSLPESDAALLGAAALIWHQQI